MLRDSLLLDLLLARFLCVGGHVSDSVQKGLLFLFIIQLNFWFIYIDEFIELYNTYKVSQYLAILD